MVTRRALRATFVALLLLSAAVIAHGVVTAPRTGTASDVPAAPPRDGITVATESAKFGTIMAWYPNGSRLYYADERTKYFDVDHVNGTAATVEYAATDTINTRGPTCSDPPCTRNVIERANLSTGEIEEIYARYDAAETAGEWHDHERINSTHIVIADMIDDQVFIVNTETELIEWLWDAQSEYPVEGGGPFPEDWVHLNDVDVLADGRIMVSMRNQDQVVFLDPDSGLQRNWTLGSEDDHAVLFEQHNPDYIPAERGGPAVVVADSENGRLVEYQRENGEWTRTWEWTDERMQWPRDADRLPNGNTLAVDTHGDRLLEISPDGSVVWSVTLEHPYDVERLGTGEDSAGGESAARLGLEPRSNRGGEADGGAGDDSDIDPLGTISAAVKSVIPHRIVNGVIYVAPLWVGREQFFAAGLGLFTVLAWSALEIRWRFPDLAFRSPMYRDDSG